MRTALRALRAALGGAIALDALVLGALAIVWRWPWNAITAGGGLALIAGALYSLRQYRMPHLLLNDRLVLRLGAFRLEVPLAQLASAAPLASVPQKVASAAEVRPAYAPEDDTLYMLPRRQGLVELQLTAPLSSRLSWFGQPVTFTRIVLGLDEPQGFLQALQPVSVATEASEPLAAGATVPAMPGEAPSAHEGAGTQAQVPPAHRVTGSSRPMRLAASPRPVPPARAGEAAIVLENLTKRYGDFVAVRGVSLTVHPGEILAFLGCNGAGKTTTIRMMMGLPRSTAGRVLMHGKDIWRDGPAARRHIGYVPDTPLLYDSLTAQEFLWFIGGLYELDPKETKARAAELLELLQMTPWRDQLIRSFSLGMRRKMSIAAALMHRPKVLLLDEVTNGLDPRSARVVKDLILAEAARGTAVRSGSAS